MLRGLRSGCQRPWLAAERTARCSLHPRRASTSPTPPRTAPHTRLPPAACAEASRFAEGGRPRSPRSASGANPAPAPRAGPLARPRPSRQDLAELPEPSVARELGRARHAYHVAGQAAASHPAEALDERRGIVPKLHEYEPRLECCSHLDAGGATRTRNAPGRASRPMVKTPSARATLSSAELMAKRFPGPTPTSSS